MASGGWRVAGVKVMTEILVFLVVGESGFQPRTMPAFHPDSNHTTTRFLCPAEREWERITPYMAVGLVRFPVVGI